MDSKKNDTSASGDAKDTGQKIPENNPSKPMDSKREVEKSNDAKIEEDFPGYPHYPAKEDIMDQRTDSHKTDMDVENLPNSHNTTTVDQRFLPKDDRKSETPDATQQTASAANDENDFSDLNPRTELSGDSRNAEIGVPQNVDNDDSSTAGTDLADDDTVSDRSTEGDVTAEERMVLENVSMPTHDADSLRRAALDSTDFDGDQLNEDGFGEVTSSVDLDIPDEVDETTTTSLGQGDEENKYYSLGGDRHEAQEEDPQSGPVRDNY